VDITLERMFRRKRLVNVSDLERWQRIGWRFAVVLGLLVGALHLCLLGAALVDGSIGAPNKMQIVKLSRDAEPIWFWFYFCWWALFGLVAFIVAFRAFRKLRIAQVIH